MELIKSFIHEIRAFMRNNAGIEFEISLLFGSIINQRVVKLETFVLVEYRGLYVFPL